MAKKRKRKTRKNPIGAAEAILSGAAGGTAYFLASHIAKKLAQGKKEYAKNPLTENELKALNDMIYQMQSQASALREGGQFIGAAQLLTVASAYIQLSLGLGKEELPDFVAEAYKKQLAKIRASQLELQELINEGLAGRVKEDWLPPFPLPHALPSFSLENPSGDKKMSYYPANGKHDVLVPGDVLTIDGVKYIVLKRQPLIEVKKADPFSAKMMKKMGFRAMIYYQRPSGDRVYIGYEVRQKGQRLYTKPSIEREYSPSQFYNNPLTDLEVDKLFKEVDKKIELARRMKKKGWPVKAAELLAGANAILRVISGHGENFYNEQAILDWHQFLSGKAGAMGLGLPQFFSEKGAWTAAGAEVLKYSPAQEIMEYTEEVGKYPHIKEVTRRQESPFVEKYESFLENPMHPSSPPPSKLETVKGEKVHKVLWKNVRTGNIVYLYAFHEGKEYAAGPFRVLDPDKRILTRVDSKRSFFHVPEELYRLDIEQNPQPAATRRGLKKAAGKLLDQAKEAAKKFDKSKGKDREKAEEYAIVALAAIRGISENYLFELLTKEEKEEYNNIYKDTMTFLFPGYDPLDSQFYNNPVDEFQQKKFIRFHKMGMLEYKIKATPRNYKVEMYIQGESKPQKYWFFPKTKKGKKEAKEFIERMKAYTPKGRFKNPMNAQVMTTIGVRELPEHEQAIVLKYALQMALDPKPEPSMYVLDPDAKKKKFEDQKRTVRFPFKGSRKVWIKKDDYGDPDDPEGVPAEFRRGVTGRYVVTALLPEEY